MRNKFISRVPTLLLIALILLILISDFVNLAALCTNGTGFGAFCFSLLYIAVWWFFLLTCIKRRSKMLLSIYIIFWAVEIIYFVLYTFALETFWGKMLYGGVGVLLKKPLMGFYCPYWAFQNVFRLDFLYDLFGLPLLLVSIAMLMFGIIVSKNGWRVRSDCKKWTKRERLKRALFAALYLLTPCFLFALSLSPMINYSDFARIYIKLIYVITAVGIILFLKFKPCGFWALLVGLFVSPTFIYVYEYNTFSYMKYFGTWMVTVLYDLPFSLISLIVFAVKEGRKLRKGHML